MMKHPNSSLAPWHAIAYYRAGLTAVEWYLNEIAHLHNWIEAGPHWDTIDHIEIRPINDIDGATLTLEEAARRFGGRGPLCAMKEDALSGRARWHANVHYRADAGLIDVDMYVRELGDLHTRIELGPHRDTIDHIEIRRINHIDGATLTLEAAARRFGGPGCLHWPWWPRPTVR
jgi:hypothetical protein